jgi:hypothetical protein
MQVYPGIIVTQCPMLGVAADGKPLGVETLTAWKRMVIEQVCFTGNSCCFHCEDVHYINPKK